MVKAIYSEGIKCIGLLLAVSASFSNSCTFSMIPSTEFGFERRLAFNNPVAVGIIGFELPSSRKLLTLTLKRLPIGSDYLGKLKRLEELRRRERMFVIN